MILFYKSLSPSNTIIETLISPLLGDQMDFSPVVGS